MAEWLLRLTEEFDLTYQLEGEKCNIVPCLLPEKRPTFEWPEMNKNEGIFETTMIYRFDYLPAGLFNRGQVRLHGYSEDSVIWKRGSFLKKSGQLALIQQIKDSELNVKVQGMRPDNMLFFVHEVFEGLIIESFHGVTYDYEIPCPDCTKQYVKDPHMFKASGIRRALELKAPFLQCQKYFHTAPVLDLQGILAPDTNSDYEVHLDQDVNNLQHMQSEMSVDLFILYCIKDAPTNRSKVIHPADVCSDLEKEGYTCYMPEGKELISREEMAKRLVHASVILVFMSNNYAASDICCDMFKYTVNTMKKPTFVVAVGENFDWQQSPSLGVFMSDVVFVNMINSKKAVYNTKFAELLSTLQKNEQLNLSKPETSNACFVSYSWVNSHAAVECGTRELPGAIGNGDPRELKKYLEDNGIGCWIDVEQVNVNDQLFSRIAKGMSEARIMLACVSDEYVQSKNCCKELRFAIQLGLPLVIAVVGTGDHWKRSEVGFHSLSYPTVDFQRINSNASEDLLKLVKTHILAEHQEDAEERKRKKDWANEEKTNRSFQEMYELAQRKFLRQISSYASAQDIGNYPRLFVVDIVAKPASDKVSGEESSADSFKSRRYSVSTLCECEQGWHSVSDPIMLKDNFATVLLEEYASYLARITMLLQHSLNFVLGLYGDVDGQNYLKRIQEMALKSSNDFQTCYHKLRQVVSELDSRGGKGKLHRCRLPSGKTIWLCEAHSTKMKVTVLSDKVTEVKHKVTNQPWLDAMVDCLRMDQKHPFHFKSTMKGKRVPEALKVDDVERDMRRTMSRSASTLNKSALHKATMKEVLREIKMEESSQSTEKTAKKTSVKGKVEFKEAPTVIDGERNVDTVMKGKGTSEEVKRETKDQEVVENANNSQQDVNSIGASHSTETPKPEENTTTPQTNQNTPTPQAGENGPQSKETTPTPQATANSPAHNSIQNTPTTGPKAKDTTPVSSPKKVQPTTQPSNTVKQQPQAESKACILL